MLTTRKLGTRGLSTSALGLGCMGMSQSYGTSEERDERESIATIHRAIELGVTFFDTAQARSSAPRSTRKPTSAATTRAIRVRTSTPMRGRRRPCAM